MVKLKCRYLVLSSVVVAGSVFLSSITSAASAASMGFSLGGSDNFGSDSIKADFVLTEVENGVKFDVTVDKSVNLADLRGIFFNIKNESLLSGLTLTSGTYNQLVTGGKGKNQTTETQKVNYVTNYQFGPANSLTSLGGDINLNGSGKVGAFDGVLEIGTSGIGKDDLQFASFTLSHANGVSLADFGDQGFGVRMMSVGDNRAGSSKADAYIPPYNPNPEVKPPDPVEVPEPTALTALGLVVFGALKIKRKPLV